MQSTETPKKIPIAFARDGDKRAIPDTSQIGIVNGAASFPDGFPPLTFIPKDDGGIPPAGADFNGVLNAVTNVQRWQSAGGQFKFDSVFSASVGGYPKGAMLQKADESGHWISLVEGNTVNPDAGASTNWRSSDYRLPAGVTNLQNFDTNTFTANYDITAALAAAVASMPNGGTILFPPGMVLLLSTQITMRANVTIDFNGSTLKQKDGSNLNNMIYAPTAAAGCRIRRGIIDVNAQNQTYTSPRGDVGRGVFANQVTGMRIEQIKFRNPYGSMILAALSSAIVVEECDINDVNGIGHNAIEFNAVTSSDVIRCTGTGKVGVTGYGIYAHGECRRIRAINNSFQYWQIVMIGNDYITSGAQSSMVYCSIDENILLNPSADTSIHFGLYCSVEGNIIVDSRDVGISMDYTQHTTVNDNVIRTTNASGIALPGCANMSISGNVISNPGSQFVRPVFDGLRCGIWVPSRSDENNPTQTPVGIVITGNAIRDQLGTPQMYIGIFMEDVGGTNVNFVEANYVAGAISADLNLPPQTNIGKDKVKKFLSLSNGWVNAGSPLPSLNYWKDDIGNVFLEGVISGGALNTVIATLPVGYRPNGMQYPLSVTVSNGTAASAGRVDVTPSGDIIMVAGSTTGAVNMSGQRFTCR